MSKPWTEEQREDDRLARALEIGAIENQADRIKCIQLALRTSYLQGQLDQMGDERRSLASFGTGSQVTANSGY